MVVILLVLAISLVFGKLAGAQTIEPERKIGLHDKILSFEQEEVRLVDGNLVVPFKKIANYLYADTIENEIIQVRKNGYEISYDYRTGKTFNKGVEVDRNPVIDIEGTLFIGIRYIAEQFGFKVDYLSNVRTARIYRDDYPHMGNRDFENYVRNKLTAVTTPNKPQKANVYLTFDDGPNKFTTINNSTLKKYNVQGTFFFLGKHMKSNPSIVNNVATDGHYIGTHSMTHDKSKVYQSAKSFIDEMNEGAALVRQMTGQDAKLLRVPYGSQPHVTKEMKSQLNKFGYKMWDWHVDSNDWRYTDDQSGEIMENVRSGVDKSFKSGNRDIIVLLHDRSQTAKVLPKIIEWLQKEGYTIKKYESSRHITKNFLLDASL